MISNISQDTSVNLFWDFPEDTSEYSSVNEIKSIRVESYNPAISVLSHNKGYIKA